MTLGMDTDAQLAQYFDSIWRHLDEHARRLVAASKAVELGYGGISRVSRACGLSRVTLSKGVEELGAEPLAPGRIRHEGGGRHALTSNDPGLAPALDGLVEPTARGDPESPLRWTCKSARTLAAELTARRHPVSHTKVAQLLRVGGYSLMPHTFPHLEMVLVGDLRRATGERSARQGAGESVRQKI